MLSLDFEKQKHKSNFLLSLVHSKKLLYLIIFVEFVIILVLINPLTLYQNFLNMQVRASVAELSGQELQGEPVIAIVSSADTLRNENAIQNQIYKDAQDGDYVLGYTNNIIIVYRKGENKIIYEGANPQTLLQQTQQGLIESIKQAAIDAGLIDAWSEEIPEVSIISDAKSLRVQNPQFYKDARNNDMVALFPQSGVILLLNDSGEIISSGQYSTTIN